MAWKEWKDGGFHWVEPPDVEFEQKESPHLSPAQCKAELVHIVKSIMASRAGDANIVWGSGGIRGAASTSGLKFNFETWN